MTEINPRPTHNRFRSPLFAFAAAWFLLAAFLRIQDDSIAELIDLVKRLAFGLAVVAVALIDWQRFRWWWVLVGLVVVALLWTATGHPLFFLFGGI